ncbi:MAG: PhoPQ-activated pathogenicity protein, partial [Gammaproteobacteria bacterium]|nr:PhoPQ-activated pathogenicity protein [Gammaproteobacteria bacterium]
MFVPAARAGDELGQYVARADASYAVRTIASGRVGSAQYLAAILTSQTWRGIVWKHQLFLVKPSKLDEPPAQALLFIDGGSWEPGYETTTGEHLPREAGVFVRLAEALRAPVAIVRQVPFEPLFGGLREDALIAYTFQQYL